MKLSRTWLAVTLVLSALAMSLPYARAESLGDLAAQAQDAFWKDDFRGAIAAYQRLIEDFGVENAALYFNVGTAYAKAGQPGRAVHAFRRAEGFHPEGQLAEDLEMNLAFVREELLERYRKELPEAQFAFTEAEGLGYRVFHLVPEPMSRWGFGAVWAVFFLLAGAYRLRKVQGARVRGALVALGVLVVLSGGYWVGNVQTSRTTRLAVIASSGVEAREGRHPNAPAHAVPEGLEVRLVDTTDPEWARIELANGLVGWVPSEHILEI